MIGIVIVVVGVLIVAAILLVFAAPQLFSGLGKLLISPFRKVIEHSDSRTGAAAKPKARKLSPNEVLMEQLKPGQVLRYKIPSKWGGNLLILELNPNYPDSGNKYVLSVENSYNGSSNENKRIICQSDSTLDLENSILAREGELLSTKSVSMAENKGPVFTNVLGGQVEKSLFVLYQV